MYILYGKTETDPKRFTMMGKFKNYHKAIRAGQQQCDWGKWTIVINEGKTPTREEQLPGWSNGRKNELP